MLLRVQRYDKMELLTIPKNDETRFPAAFHNGANKKNTYL